MSNLLNEYVETVLASTAQSDPREIAAEVLASISDADLRDCLEEALPMYVSRYLTRGRSGVPTPEKREKDLKPVAPVRSAKVGAIRDHWAKFLEERVQVNGNWKKVADCTVQDVQALARERREVAAKNVAHAKRFEKLAEDMQAQGAATVAEFKPGRQPQPVKAS